MPDVFETPADTMRRRLGMLDQLVVTGHHDFLLVDAGALADGAGDIRYWRLTPTGAGTWRHAESGNEGNLGHLLRAIAWSYDAPKVPA